MALDIELTESAGEDLDHWKKCSPATFKKIGQLITSCCETPFEGLGKPERLRWELSGYWSRRINHHDRMVYCIENGKLIIISLRYHYQKD